MAYVDAGAKSAAVTIPFGTSDAMMAQLLRKLNPNKMSYFLTIKVFIGCISIMFSALHNSHGWKVRAIGMA